MIRLKIGRDEPQKNKTKDHFEGPLASAVEHGSEGKKVLRRMDFEASLVSKIR